MTTANPDGLPNWAGHGYEDYDESSLENLPPDETWQEYATHQLDHDPTPGQAAKRVMLEDGGDNA